MSSLLNPKQYNFGNDIRSGGSILGPAMKDTYSSLAGTIPQYNNYVKGEINRFSNPEGLNSVVNQNRTQLLGQAADTGRDNASTLAFQGFGAATQDAGQMAAKQAALAHANAFQNHMATPEGRQQIGDYLAHLEGQLGVNHPGYQMIRDMYQQMLEREHLSNEAKAAQGPSFLQSLAGTAGQVGGMWASGGFKH